ncbi:MAG: hypothetical protein Q4A92_10995 [Corynebacterium sp.]|nr:hypothetical protein [Corynebacterium sp.]
MLLDADEDITSVVIRNTWFATETYSPDGKQLTVYVPTLLAKG